MKYEDKRFLIYYNESDKIYIPKLIDIINAKIYKILNFFKLDLQKKIVIKIYNDIDEYKKKLEESFQKEALKESRKQQKNIEPRKYQNWMIANTEDGNINMQSLDLVKKLDNYKNYTEEEFCYNVCHEFVHLCQQQLNSENPSWFWEVIATTLGNPECQHEIQESFTLDDLNNFDQIDGYGATYKIGKYLFANYELDFILEMIKDNRKLYDTISQVIIEVNKDIKVEKSI